MTFFSVRTALTAFTLIHLPVCDITVFGFVWACIAIGQLPVVRTEIFICFGIVLHMLRSEFIIPVLSCLADFIILRLDVGIVSVLLQISEVFFAGISRIGYQIPDLSFAV